MIATQDTIIEMREINSRINKVEVFFHQLMVSSFSPSSSSSSPFAHPVFRFRFLCWVIFMLCPLLLLLACNTLQVINIDTDGQCLAITVDGKERSLSLSRTSLFLRMAGGGHQTHPLGGSTHKNSVTQGECGQMPKPYAIGPMLKTGLVQNSPSQVPFAHVFIQTVQRKNTWPRCFF